MPFFWVQLPGSLNNSEAGMVIGVKSSIELLSLSGNRESGINKWRILLPIIALNFNEQDTLFLDAA